MNANPTMTNERSALAAAAQTVSALLVGALVAAVLVGVLTFRESAARRLSGGAHAGSALAERVRSIYGASTSA